jgi:hypothetical protein
MRLPHTHLALHKLLKKNLCTSKILKKEKKAGMRTHPQEVQGK